LSTSRDGSSVDEATGAENADMRTTMPVVSDKKGLLDKYIVVILT
jgi:hypothetical protein